jgi:protein-disulfide isomerase
MNNKEILSAILISVILSFSLNLGYTKYFDGQKNNDLNLEQKIEQGIENFIQKQQEEQAKAQEEQAKAQEEKIAENIDKIKEVNSKNDYIKGPETATINIIEYSDYQCPYCSKHWDTLMNILKKYPEKVNLVHRHLPLSFHDPIATKQAIASECAGELGGNESFWKLSDIFYREQSENLDIENKLKEINISLEDYQNCKENSEILKRVKEDSKEANLLGINGTPGNLLINKETNDYDFIGGAYPESRFEETIEKWINN